MLLAKRKSKTNITEEKKWNQRKKEKSIRNLSVFFCVAVSKLKLLSECSLKFFFTFSVVDVSDCVYVIKQCPCINTVNRNHSSDDLFLYNSIGETYLHDKLKYNGNKEKGNRFVFHLVDSILG